MSVLAVHNAILRQLQQDATIDAAFKDDLTGTITTSGTAVVGSGTAFTTELSEGDYIGSRTKGYRRVSTITDNENIVVNEAYLSEFSAEAFSVTRISKGLSDSISLTRVGRVMKINFVTSGQDEEGIPYKRVLAAYGFVVVVGFFEPNEEILEERKAGYDAMVRNAVDKDLTFSGLTLETTEMGRLTFAQDPYEGDITWGIMPLLVQKSELTGSR